MAENRFCSFPDVNGWTSLCTSETIGLALNLYILILCLASVFYSKHCKLKGGLWSLDALSWALIIVNIYASILYTSCWLIISHAISTILCQTMNIVAAFALSLTLYLHIKFHSKYILSITVYCLGQGIAKLVALTAFSRHILQWKTLSEFDSRFIIAILQSVTFLLLVFVTTYNYIKNHKKGFIAIPDDSMRRESCLTKLFHSWCYPILRKSSQKRILSSDFNVPPSVSPPKTNIESHRSMVRVVLELQGTALIESGVILLIVSVIEFIPVFISYRILIVLQDHHDIPNSNISQNNPEMFSCGDFVHNVYSLVVFFGLAELCRSVLAQVYMFKSALIALSIQNTLQELLYKKALVLPQWSIEPDTLTFVDLTHISTGLQLIHQIWRIPIQCTVCLVILITIEYSTLVTVTVMLPCITLVVLLTYHRSSQETLLTERKQQLFIKIKEYIDNIWILKIQSYVSFFRTAILKEYDEMSEVKVKMLFLLIQIVKSTTPIFLVIVLFGVHVALERDTVLTLQQGVIIILVLNMLRNLVMLSQTVIRHLLELKAKMSDIQTFLLKDTIEPVHMVEENAYVEDDTVVNSLITITNASFAWSNARMADKTLLDINLTIPEGKLTMIVGPSGAGKSSLLAAMLSEMQCVCGDVLWKTRFMDTAYVPQYPIVLGGTVQENVLFGSGYEAERYLRVITLCNLVEHTATIEESKTNSYQQINLARALYSSASTLILDDPLAGLSPHSREQFFFESIILFAGEEKRTVVMTTTDVSLLQHAHTIIILNNGRVSYSGPPDSDEATTNPVTVELSSKTVASRPPPLPVRKRYEVQSKETREINVKDIPSASYKEWLESCQGFKLVLSLLLISSTVFVYVITFWLLLKWLVPPRHVTPAASRDNETTRDEGTRPTHTGSLTAFYLSGTGLMLLHTLSLLLISSTVSSSCRKLLEKMLLAISKCTLYYYNKLNTHAQLSRFTVDLELIGRPLTECLGSFLMLAGECTAALIVQAIVSPGCIVVILPCSLLSVWLYKFYCPAARVTRIIHNEHTQNIIKHVSESLSGLVIIRGFGKENRYLDDLKTYSNKLFDVNKVISGISCWLSTYQDILVSMIVTASLVAIVTVADKNKLEMTALAIVLIFLAAQQFRLIWNYLESCDFVVNSIDGCVQTAYHTPSEEETPRFIPPKTWPQVGNISFQEVFASLCYEGDTIIRNLNLEIPGGSKVCVCSNQNGGKEFIVPLILRSLQVNHGVVRIDEWDLSMLSLEDLRSHIQFIPSDPPLFTGTLRNNIDPTSLYTEAEIWGSLEKVKLHEKVSKLPLKLEETDFKSFVLEEKQLLYLAHILLKPGSVILIEESKILTNLSLHDQLFDIIDRELRDATRIIIGQRSSTLLTRIDRLLFMANGKVVSYGQLYELKERRCPYYYHLAERHQRQSFRLSSIPTTSSNVDDMEDK